MENGQADGRGGASGKNGQGQYTNWEQTRVAFGLPPAIPESVCEDVVNRSLTPADVRILAVIM